MIYFLSMTSSFGCLMSREDHSFVRVGLGLVYVLGFESQFMKFIEYFLVLFV